MTTYVPPQRWKTALKNVLRHVQNKPNACVQKKPVHGVGCSGHGYGKENTVETHPTARTSLRLWMTAAKNRKINLRRVLIYLRQDATNTWMWRETPTRVRVPSPTFCLSRIFIAKYCSVPLCFTSMTLPNEPVPRVFNLSKSSRHVVLCESDNLLACSTKAAEPHILTFHHSYLWRAFPFP